MHVIACNEIYYIVLQIHYMSLHRGGFADAASGRTGRGCQWAWNLAGSSGRTGPGLAGAEAVEATLPDGFGLGLSHESEHGHGVGPPGQVPTGPGPGPSWPGVAAPRAIGPRSGRRRG